MTGLILAAGYATRLYPLTENFPKPLLPVGGKPILDWLMDDLDAQGRIDRYVVVSNHRYASHFTAWAQGRAGDAPITVLDDGSLSNQTRLGAVRDILFGVEELSIDDDLLVMAGDNLLDFSLASFLDYFQGRNATCVMRYYEPSMEKLQKTGVIQLGEGERVLSMEEKPIEPKSHWCQPPFYLYARADVPLFGRALTQGCGADAPGSLIAWLCAQRPVYAMEMPGRRYDVGDLEGYARISRSYRGIV